MDLSCHRCNNAVAEGALYCAQCGAPQIRVPQVEVIPEEGPQATVVPPPPAAGSLSWRDAIPVAAKVGTVIGLLSIPLFFLNVLQPAAVVIGGWFVVRAYEKRMNTGLRIGPSVALGTVTGLIECFVSAVVVAIGTWIYAAVLGHGEQVRNSVRAFFEQAAGQQPNPQGAAALRQLIASPTGLGIMVALFFAVFVVLTVLMSDIGALFAASMRRRK